MNHQATVPPLGTFQPQDQPSMEAIASSAWAMLETQVTPFTEVMTIPGEIFRALDAGGKKFIARNFMSYIGKNVLYCRDGTGTDRYFLGNPRNFLRGGGVIVTVKGTEPFWMIRSNTTILEAAAAHLGVNVAPKEKKIPRPPNAYILYRKERHNLVRDAHPGITNNEISQVLGAAWNAESREVRQKYKEMSDKIKKALYEQHPDYQYRPRKPSEKKRRGRRTASTDEEIEHDSDEVAQPSSAD
ncbi:unnamed protein product [Clonostachys solani]|uniref:HMG box domain-containing protein n=1 Tax=Clonostachys solani TaxID=160281 RepID=A0A9N9YZQ2_9HYPO|nr:unnamed protein product [Clonostachys solani]